MVPLHGASAISNLTVDLQVIIKELEDLCSGLTKFDQQAPRPVDLQVSKRMWVWKKSKITELRSKANTTKSSLILCFGALISSQSAKQTRLLLDIKQIVEAASSRSSSEQLQGAQTAGQTNQDNTNEIDASLDQAHAELTNRRRTLRVGHHDNLVSSTPKDDSPVPIFVLAFSQQSCSLYCKCQCHLTSFFQTPEWIPTVFSSLLFQCNSMPILRPEKCDVTGCRNQSSLRLVYLFPKWFVSQATTLATSWNGLTGIGATIHLQVSRIVPSGQMLSVVLNSDENWIKQSLSNSTIFPTDVDEDGCSLLMLSLRYVNLTLAEFLLEQGWPTNTQSWTGCLDDIGWSPLHWAIYLGDYNSFSILLHQRTGIETTSRGGWTPLHFAAYYEPPGSVRMARELLDAGADVHARVTSPSRSIGETAIIFAFDNPEMIELLLAHGAATVIQTDLNLESPLSYRARGTCNIESHDPRRHNWERSLDLLINAGMDLDTPSQQASFEGRTPIHDTILWRNAALLEVLLQRGARQDATDKEGSNMLHFAAQSANSELIEILRGAHIKGINSNQQNTAGDTPMKIMIARMLGDPRRRQPGEVAPTYDEMLAFKHLLQEIEERNSEISLRNLSSFASENRIQEIGGEAITDESYNRIFHRSLVHPSTSRHFGLMLMSDAYEINSALVLSDDNGDNDMDDESEGTEFFDAVESIEDASIG
nr:uncharacterized protein CTRU02_06812 [Colletotrichum truncatum]KAF6792195.1 hypothetical protein CTRU02_06812 [Colletotrichum truncatum]